MGWGNDTVSARGWRVLSSYTLQPTGGVTVFWEWEVRFPLIFLSYIF